MTATKHSSRTYGRTMFETLETAQSNRVKSTFLIDLRRRSRFDTCLPGEAFAESGEHLYVMIANISLSGLRLECCRQAADTLLASRKGRAPDAESRASLKVHFSVPIDSEQLATVKVQCRIVYTRRGGKDICQAGMEFVTFEEGRAALSQYLSYRWGAR